MNQSVLKFGISFSVLVLATSAMASQTIHYFENFTDGVIDTALEATPHAGQATPTLQTQSAWRNPTQTFLGAATPFNNTQNSYKITTNANLSAGNVWVFDIGIISDVARGRVTGYSGVPGVSIEEITGADGPTMKISAGTQRDGSEPENSRALFGDVNPTLQGGSPTNEDNTAIDFASNSIGPVNPTMSDAALPNELNGVLRATWVYQPKADNNTRISVKSTFGNEGYDAQDSAGVSNQPFPTTVSEIVPQIWNPSPAAFKVRLSEGAVPGNVVANFNTYSAGVVASLQIGITDVLFKQVGKADSNTDGVVNGAGDAPIWVANFGGSGKSFFQGDSSGDGVVNGAGDAPVWVSQFGTDVVGPGGLLVEYTPSTGAVKVSMNNIGSLRLISADGLIIPGSAPTAGQVPGTVFHDPPTVNETNYAGFPLNTQDDLSLGVFLPTGLATINEQTVATSKFSVLYTVFGGSEINIPLSVFNTEFVPIPEPGTLGLAVLAGVGMLRVTRRRRRKLA